MQFQPWRWGDLVAYKFRDYSGNINEIAPEVVSCAMVIYADAHPGGTITLFRDGEVVNVKRPDVMFLFEDESWALIQRMPVPDDVRERLRNVLKKPVRRRGENEHTQRYYQVMNIIVFFIALLLSISSSMAIVILDPIYEALS